jgi:hypothetical protein
MVTLGRISSDAALANRDRINSDGMTKMPRSHNASSSNLGTMPQPPALSGLI